MARARRDTESSLEPEGYCAECKDPESQVRSAHQLRLATTGGIDFLKTHLYQFFAQSPRITTDERRETIESVCLWAAGVIRQWSGFVDETTGAPLPWHEARRQFAARRDAIARTAYGQAPETYKQKYPYDRGGLPTVAGFGSVAQDVSTYAQQRGAPSEDEYIPEPSEYTAELEETPDVDE